MKLLALILTSAVSLQLLAAQPAEEVLLLGCEADMATLAGDYDYAPTEISVRLTKSRDGQEHLTIQSRSQIGTTTDIWFLRKGEMESRGEGIRIRAKQSGFPVFDQTKRRLQLTVNGDTGALILKSKDWGIFQKWTTELAFALRCGENQLD